MQHLTISKSTSKIAVAMFSLLLFALKMVPTVLPALLFAGVQGHSFRGLPTYLNNTQSLTGFPPCDALVAANLSHIVHMPSSPLYSTLVQGSWTLDTQRQPFCFARPNTPAEVSQTLLALQSVGDGAGDWHVAIRSGGHASDYASSIDNGVTIDLSQLNASTYNAATNIASIGTGARWGDVYADLEKYGVSVTGGRQGVVGVGGLVLGGGVSWYTQRTGFACDSVVNYEIVLADGRIINANESAHPELWRALKGGGSNFGIVTRFDVEAFPAQNLSIGTRTIAANHSDEVVDAIAGFTNLDSSFHDNALLVLVAYTPGAGIVINVTEVNTANNPNSTAYDAFKRIPTLVPSTQVSVTLPESAADPFGPGNSRLVGNGPLTLSNDPHLMRYCVTQHASLVSDLINSIGPHSFSTILDFQPLPRYISDISVEKGGNMLGLERSPRSKVHFVAGVTLLGDDRDQQYPLVYQKIAAMNQRITAFGKSIGAIEEWIYLNYADAAQDSLGSYGAENVKHIRKAAARYDPYGFFQEMVPGGFKIDRVG